MRRPDPLATAILGGITAFVAGGIVWAQANAPHAPSEDHCGECSPPVIAPAPGVLWVAAGRLLYRFDPVTGARSPAIEVWPADGRHDVAAMLWDRGRVLVAWDGGAGILRGGRVVRHTIHPAMRRVVLVHGRDAAHVLGGRRLIRIRPDGSPGAVRRFRTRGLAEAAARAVAGGPIPAPSAWYRPFTLAQGEFRVTRHDDLTLWLSRVDPATGTTRWSTKIPLG
ncbi:MAG: hypothetical protein IT200_05145 [Thermoleophilia bacterium]|nr:hypothetical protein [Thermoleophilia bacterium]